MMFEVCVLFLLFSFNASAQEIDSRMRWGCKKCICPNTSLEHQTDAELLATQKKISIDFLSIEIPNLSKLGKEYIRISKELISGSNMFHASMAIINSYWLSVNKPVLSQKPDGCVMAALINATVEFYQYNKREPMVKALQLLDTKIVTDIGTVAAKSQIVSGCYKPGTPTSINEIQITNQLCFNNGYTYKFDEIWQMRGGTIPNDFRCVVSKMYKCNNFIDNFLALIATYALTPIRETNRIANISLASGVEFASLQLGSILPKCCCKNFLHQLEKLTDKMKTVTSQVFTSEAALFSTSNVCCKKG